MEPRREAVLRELGEAWDEIGEAEADRREALRALEDDCLALYRAELARLRQRTARLRRDVADAVAELAAIRAALGDPGATVQSSSAGAAGGRRSLSLKEELGAIAPELEEMRRRRDERRRLFQEVTDMIDRIEQEMYSMNSNAAADGDSDGDLTMSRLQELRARLGDLQSEKENRIKKVAELTSSLHSSSLVLGMDSREIDLEEGDISDGGIARLLSEIEHLREIKRDRMQKLQDLVATMFELWNLMDTPPEEQSRFQDVACNIAASEDEITEPGALSVGFIANVEAEVVRLESLKESRMKDLLLKKHDELREIRRRTRIAAAADGDDGEDGGAVLVFDAINDDAERSMILERLEVQISEAKEEEFSRKDVLERMERWQAALEEESWLEEYNRNENRYNVGKGMHLMLKRAEKARALVSKMPAMAEALTAKVLAWEKERGEKFEYDGEGLLDMLEEYDNARKEKEHERKRQRDQRKSQGQNRVESPVARALPKSIKNVTRTLSMGRSGSKKVAVSSSSLLSSSRPSTPSFLKSPMSSRGSDDGQMIASGPFD